MEADGGVGSGPSDGRRRGRTERRSGAAEPRDSGREREEHRDERRTGAVRKRCREMEQPDTTRTQAVARVGESVWRQRG